MLCPALSCPGDLGWLLGRPSWMLTFVSCPQQRRIYIDKLNQDGTSSIYISIYVEASTKEAFMQAKQASRGGFNTRHTAAG